MGYVFKKNIANRGNYGDRRNTSNIKYIAVHYTSNDGDHDESNANYFKNRIINVKYTVYDKPRDEKGRWYIEITENFYISSTKENKKNVSDIFDKEMNSDIIQDIVKYEIW